MEDRSYSSLSRYGLASSNSLLDGVPFKIGPNFIPPIKVFAGPELCRPAISPLAVEYTFETEEAVLAWAKAREEALKQASQELAKKTAEEQRKQEVESNSEENVDNNSNIRQDNDTNQNGGNIYDVPRNTDSAIQNHAFNKQKPNVLPRTIMGISKPMSEPGTILKPTPIQSAASSVAVKTTDTNADNRLANTNSSFDVSMFESESDPFENLELQTLNDMEELKILLDSSKKPTSNFVFTETDTSHQKSSLDSDLSTGLHVNSAAEAIYDVATVVKENAWETFSDDSPDDNTCIETDGETPDQKDVSPIGGYQNGNETPELIMEDEYVEITNDYKQQQTITFHNHSVSATTTISNSEELTDKNNSSAIFGGKLPSNLANSKLYKPVLPPFIKSAIDNSYTDNNPFNQLMLNGSNPFLSQAAVDTKDINSSHEAISSNTKSSSPTPVSKSSLVPPPPVASRRNKQNVQTSRMWSSVGPSLAGSFDETSTSTDYTSRNSQNRHSLSSSDIHSSSSFSDLGEVNKSQVLQKPSTSLSSFQLWTRNRPLPPIPTTSPAITHTTNSFPDSYKASVLAPTQQVGLTDPYYSLSHEAQAFTNSLTSMGFLRARVSRAVAKFGQDEKEVLDHLLAVDMLVDKKFAPVLAESALNTFKNDIDKAEKYLQMLTQFEELGFKSDKIQEALIASNMDHDKVLDILTTT